MQILEQHDAHVATFVRYRQRIRWEGNLPVCHDCRFVRVLGLKPMLPSELQSLGRNFVPAPLWTRFEGGWAYRVCGPCYRDFYSKAPSN